MRWLLYVTVGWIFPFFLSEDMFYPHWSLRLSQRCTKPFFWGEGAYIAPGAQLVAHFLLCHYLSCFQVYSSHAWGIQRLRIIWGEKGVIHYSIYCGTVMSDVSIWDDQVLSCQFVSIYTVKHRLSNSWLTGISLIRSQRTPRRSYLKV